eukprot:1143634-Pelagomonas_calceolata.AAC.5
MAAARDSHAARRARNGVVAAVRVGAAGEAAARKGGGGVQVLGGAAAYAAAAAAARSAATAAGAERTWAAAGSGTGSAGCCSWRCVAALRCVGAGWWRLEAQACCCCCRCWRPLSAAARMRPACPRSHDPRHWTPPRQP